MDIMLQRILSLLGDRYGGTKDLASFLGVSGNTITNWKSGLAKSYPKYAPAIAEYYGVSLDWLSGLTDEKTPTEKPAAPKGDELKNIDARLASQLRDLTPEEADKVRAFIAGMKA